MSGLSTIRDHIRWAASRFSRSDLYYGHGTSNPMDEAAWLVLSVVALGQDLHPDYMDCALADDEKARITDIVERRISERVPLAYLLEEAHFAGLEFYVNRSVLVPRSPIAELITDCFEPWIEPDRVERVLDLCTGSGCIAIACAYAFDEAVVDAGEISPEAIEVARKNIEKHGLEQRVNLFHSDLFEHIPARHYDIIVSNPPYVDADDMAALPDEYRAEPSLGLAAGADGLDIVRRILANAADFLAEEGILIVEVGNSENHLQYAFPDVPFLWLEFEAGGHGVFLLTKEQLVEHAASFEAGVKS